MSSDLLADYNHLYQLLRERLILVPQILTPSLDVS